MSEYESVVGSLVEMADTLVDDYDVIDVLTSLADRCVHLLGASAAGVMLASSQGDLRLVASSSEAMRVLEVFELQAQEGPCLDAYRTGATRRAPAPRPPTPARGPSSPERRSRPVSRRRLRCRCDYGIGLSAP